MTERRNRSSGNRRNQNANSRGGPRNNDRNGNRIGSPKGRNPRDNFRPPQGDFTFTAPGSDRYRSHQSDFEGSGGPHDRNKGGRDHWRPRGRGGRGGYGGRGGRPQWQRFNASERPMLTLDSSEPPISLRDGKDGVRYRTLDEMSDDSELEMEISEDDSSSGNERAGKRIKSDHTKALEDDADDDAEPPTKRARRSSTDSLPSVDGDNPSNESAPSGSAASTQPRWSNPNPYTAIPQADSNQNKPKDLVKLIRKGRIEEDKANQVGELDELIFFEDSDAEKPARIPPSSPDDQTWTNVSATTTPTNPDLGSRKRNIDDVIKPLPRNKHRESRGMSTLNTLCGQWILPPGRTLLTPWAKGSTESSISERLNQEVRDFYSYVEPRKYEEAMRQNLIDRLKQAIKRNYNLADCEVACFGSFMSGLYLPTADMDLVIVSRKHFNGGYAQPRPKSFMYKFRAFLVNNQLCQPDSIQMIIGAKVPIVKYVDRETNLSVDVSFENLSGVDAIATFAKWRDEFPVMPKLVTLIKNFLAIRALNEPVNGGIGGFSVCCLVVSMLQLHSAIQSRNMKEDEHIGELMMEFFNLYGNNFDFTKVALQMNPPAYVPKTMVQSLTYKNVDRLSIIDPNNIANDISGGSSRFSEISSCFSAAYATMQDRLEAVESGKKTVESLLQPILGGNYAHFDEQRTILEEAYGRLVTKNNSRPSGNGYSSFSNSGNSNGYSNGHSLPARPPAPPYQNKHHPPPSHQKPWSDRRGGGGGGGGGKRDKRRDRR